MSPTDSAIQLRTADPNDAGAIARIYNHYVTNSTVTFEEGVVDHEEMARRVREVLAKGLPWILASEAQAILGYAYATPWRTRSAYRQSVEVTVYLAPQHTGKGIGSRLYTTLLNQLQQSGFRTAIGVIALPNPDSVRLHEHFGFEKAAHLKQVGYKMGQWVDVGYWQLVFAAAESPVPR
jgi:phosphinothricin acetyltransferase